jgi:hypothetical protein
MILGSAETAFESASALDRLLIVLCALAASFEWKKAGCSCAKETEPFVKKFKQTNENLIPLPCTDYSQSQYGDFATFNPSKDALPSGMNSFASAGSRTPPVRSACQQSSRRCFAGVGQNCYSVSRKRDTEILRQGRGELLRPGYVFSGARPSWPQRVARTTAPGGFRSERQSRGCCGLEGRAPLDRYDRGPVAVRPVSY